MGKQSLLDGFNSEVMMVEVVELRYSSDPCSFLESGEHFQNAVVSTGIKVTRSNQLMENSY